MTDPARKPRAESEIGDIHRFIILLLFLIRLLNSGINCNSFDIKASRYVKRPLDPDRAPLGRWTTNLGSTTANR